MEEGLNRREFLKKVIIGAGATLGLNNSVPEEAEAVESRFQFLSSEMTQEILERQKEAAVTSLMESIPTNPELDYLRSYIPHLKDESQMYIPSPEEITDVVAKNESPLNELAKSVETGSFGLFIFADVDSAGVNIQRLYVLQKNSRTAMHFVKGYLVSTSQNGFGNDADSGKTPLGLHTIDNGTRGLFGEVVSALNKHRDEFNRVKLADGDHWFVKGFGQEGGNDIAEVVTDQYQLKGPHTSLSRGIRIHGTNRSGTMDSDGKWKSFLGGKRRSGGCIRMSNTDVRDLSLSHYIWAPNSRDENDRVHHVGSYVMISTTQKAQDSGGKPTKEEIASRPARWHNPLEEPQTEKVVPGIEDPAVNTKGRPPRWIPPEER